ncbi:MAG: hypothetical protein IJ293_01685 [Treponema sp.]|jgi:hypothetical protein|nr:hypothetical protein [Treponema sp.]
MKDNVEVLYKDIINLERPRPMFREQMKLENRAKIFLPFAALKGFEEEIERRKEHFISSIK